jgi:hypothetical protein
MNLHDLMTNVKAMKPAKMASTHTSRRMRMSVTPRTVDKANAARTITATQQRSTAFNRLRSTIQRNEATNAANHMILESGSFEDRLSALDREDQIDRLLKDLKARQPRLT